MNFLIFIATMFFILFRQTETTLVYTPSDAYQESILRPYRSYSDVAIFHFTVPPQSSKAVWQFVAFMDDPRCPSMPVFIHLRHGSYPVVRADNGTHPPTLRIPADSLRIETRARFQPTEMPEFRVSNPLPGSWFVVAYYIDANKNIRQKGIQRMCQYSVGSMAAWSRQNDVLLLNPHSSLPVSTPPYLNVFKYFDKLLKSSSFVFHTKAIFDDYDGFCGFRKVFVSEGTWRFVIRIKDCVSKDDIGGAAGGVCEFRVGCRARALPPLAENVTTTIAPKESYRHVVDQPETEVYYYVIVESLSNMTYTIENVLEDCPMVWNISEKSVRQPRHLLDAVSAQLETDDETRINNNNDSFIAFATLHRQEQIRLNVSMSSSGGINDTGGSGGIVSSSLLASSSADEAQLLRDVLGESGMEAAMKGCLPVVQLTRIKHAQDFLDSFLVQGPEWFTSWLSLTDKFLLLVKFRLEPFVDIGGTLQIKIQMDPSVKRAPTERVSIEVCITHNRPPQFATNATTTPDSLRRQTMHCEKATDRFVLDTSNTTQMEQYFPYPEPGTWFLGFRVFCSNGPAAGDAPCSFNQIGVDMKIRLQPCVFEGAPCGSHGFCQENHFRQFYFSTCRCVGGWRGWACTDGSGAESSASLLTATILLTISNAFFLPSIVLAFYRRFYTEGVVYSLTMFFSTFYHACDVDFYNYCLLRYEVLQFGDFYLAIVSFWMTLCAMSGLPRSIESLAHVGGAIGIAVGVQAARTSLWVFAAPSLTALAFLLLSWAGECLTRRSCYPDRKMWIRSLGPGLILAIAGLIMFAFVETEDNYKYVHSVWHMVMALSIAFFLPKTPRRFREPVVKTVDDEPTLNDLMSEPGYQPVLIAPLPSLTPRRQNTPQTLTSTPAPAFTPGSGESESAVSEYRLESDLTRLMQVR